MSKDILDSEAQVCKHCQQVTDDMDHMCATKFLSEFQNSLSFSHFKLVNEIRKRRWHHGSSRVWLGPDWGNELAGETGEACNIIKKLQRDSDGIPQSGFFRADAERGLMKELGDVVICAELIAEHFGFKLEDCVRYAFNKTSEKNGFPERL